MMRWADADKTTIIRDDGAFVPADPRNADYASLLSHRVKIDAYIEPPAPPTETASQKLDKMFVAAGIDPDEAATLLSARTRIVTRSG